MQTQRKPRYSAPLYLITLCLIVLQLMITSCSTPPAEEGINRAIDEMVEALESRHSGPVMDRLHENFRGEGVRGLMDRKQAQKLLLLIFYRHQSISVTVTGTEILPDTVNQNRASATFNVLVTGGSGGLIPDTGQIYRVKSEWQYDDDWQLLSVKSKRALAG